MSLDSDPLTPWVNDVGHFPGGCNATGPVNGSLKFPAHQLTDCTPNNNAAAVLAPDNRTLTQLQPLYRLDPGGPIIAWQAGVPQEFPLTVDLLGDGTLGAHGGSGLSSMGGTVRLGSLLSDAPLQHALKLELWSTPYYYGGLPALQNASKGNGGRNQYVWPATGSDSGSNVPGAAGGLYRGLDPVLAPGALLALPLTAAVHTSTAVGGKIKQALTEYGGYLVDDTGSKRGGGALCLEAGVAAEVKRQYGPEYDFDISSSMQHGPLYDDLLAVFQGLAVVTNNAPHSIGGGGSTSVAAPPPICVNDVSKGTLHRVGCHDCGNTQGRGWCGDYIQDGPAALQGYTMGAPGCVGVNANASEYNGLSRVSDGQHAYWIEAVPVVDQ
eukprot:TRINITY_DN21836_c0_g1_i1.p1 TRINITY_DN21836_c0_g1~~TRINITY_DN21836_c0_g1_i1.p1  ORF type:complete len:382 (+),score=79.09 TRINITY_DN21836_c0_g1_i1:242-1387(+)